MEYKRVPVSLENFAEIRQNNYYYVDKTRLIEQIIKLGNKFTLFTRPRRFGKTLNMSMLKYFFEIGTDPSLFDGLYISSDTELCKEYMGKYPVIFLSLKSVEGFDYKSAKDEFVELISRESKRFSFLQNSEKLDEDDKAIYQSLIQLVNGNYTMDEKTLKNSLANLSNLLYKYYGKKAVILIDEYDVPLDKAFKNGYYDEMVALLRAFLGNALKSNDNLEFSVLTGCLRISKESIFSGLNNFNVLSIIDDNFDEEFGFTDKEVKELLAYYHLEDKFDEMKEWYDGYHFGDADVYCPWDVINHTYRLVTNHNARPQSYWINTSGNDLVKRFIDKADPTTKTEIEELIAGNEVVKDVYMELTYEDIDRSIENLWSVLLTTGYLTYTGITESGAYKLVIPNKEVRTVFILQIQEWFSRVISSNHSSADKINKAILEGNTDVIEKELTFFLTETISILDTKARNEDKENFYHGILIGILKSYSGWAVKSNAESGDGFADILLKPSDPDTGIVIELKYARSFMEMDKACLSALNQIVDRRYEESLLEEGRMNILSYGIAFFKKRCKVMVEKNF